MIPPSDPSSALADIINLTPHHIGCAVKNLEDACSVYSGALGFKRRTRRLEIASQNISVCFVELADSFYLELISPRGGNTTLDRYLKVGFYHLTFLVDNLDAAKQRLLTHDFVELTAFESEAFPGGLCQFFLSPQMHLIELVRTTANDFLDFFNANLEIAV